MIPTVLIFAFFATMITYGIYLSIGVLRKPRENTDQEDFLWKEGYAFATLKVDAKDYEKLPHVSPMTKEEFAKLSGFSIIVCTRDHGDYLSQRMKREQCDERTRHFTLTFGRVLGTTIVERFIILHDQREIFADGFDSSHQYPVEFNAGDTLEITQTLTFLETE
jgi:hypothetical protein